MQPPLAAPSGPGTYSSAGHPAPCHHPGLAARCTHGRGETPALPLGAPVVAAAVLALPPCGVQQ
eukprot:1162043-Pelagomonas_calceolata.AAC.4